MTVVVLDQVWAGQVPVVHRSKCPLLLVASLHPGWWAVGGRQLRLSDEMGRRAFVVLCCLLASLFAQLGFVSGDRSRSRYR